MTPEKLNRALIEAVKEKIPDGVSPANVLMDILSIGKEAIYRRFRGEVPFTLSEAMILSKKLGVSLDHLNGVVSEGDGVLDLNLHHLKDPVELYYSTLEDYMDILYKVSADRHPEMWDVTNRISPIFCMNFESLSRFLLFKWLYQHDTRVGRFQKRFEDVKIPEKLKSKEREFLEIVKGCKSNHYVWDDMIFKSIINDISYFKEISMISAESLQEIKTDMLQLINDLEQLASRGHFKNGNNVQIFISHVNFETSYSYIESEEQKVCFIKIYNLNTISSRNEYVFENVKRWVQSLRKYSTIISESGDMERYKFFRQQRDYVNSL